MNNLLVVQPTKSSKLLEEKNKTKLAKTVSKQETSSFFHVLFTQSH